MRRLFQATAAIFSGSRMTQGTLAIFDDHCSFSTMEGEEREYKWKDLRTLEVSMTELTVPGLLGQRKQTALRFNNGEQPQMWMIAPFLAEEALQAVQREKEILQRIADEREVIRAELAADLARQAEETRAALERADLAEGERDSLTAELQQARRQVEELSERLAAAQAAESVARAAADEARAAAEEARATAEEAVRTAVQAPVMPVEEKTAAAPDGPVEAAGEPAPVEDAATAEEEVVETPVVSAERTEEAAVEPVASVAADDMLPETPAPRPLTDSDMRWQQLVDETAAGSQAALGELVQEAEHGMLRGRRACRGIVKAEFRAMFGLIRQNCPVRDIVLSKESFEPGLYARQEGRYVASSRSYAALTAACHVLTGGVVVAWVKALAASGAVQEALQLGEYALQTPAELRENAFSWTLLTGNIRRMRGLCDARDWTGLAAYLAQLCGEDTVALDEIDVYVQAAEEEAARIAAEMAAKAAEAAPEAVEEPEGDEDTAVGTEIVTAADDVPVEPASDEAPVEAVYDEVSAEPAYDEASVEAVYDEVPAEPAYDEASVEPANDEVPAEPAYDEALVEPAYDDAFFGAEETVPEETTSDTEW